MSFYKFVILEIKNFCAESIKPENITQIIQFYTDGLLKRMGISRQTSIKFVFSTKKCENILRVVDKGNNSDGRLGTIIAYSEDYVPDRVSEAWINTNLIGESYPDIMYFHVYMLY